MNFDRYWIEFDRQTKEQRSVQKYDCEIEL